ncbi:MAG: aromatic ring-opening dioxygenase subunit LigA [Deltaproteobacteria bacterium]|nr:aromatic ring-opening dioxygenase subunit LigA [Deltaproteobacteria bacterium]
MSLYQVQKLLFNVHNNLDLRKSYLAKPEEIAQAYDFSEEERRALRSRDIGSLYRMGVNPWLLFQFAHIVGMDNAEYLKQIRGE